MKDARKHSSEQQELSNGISAGDSARTIRVKLWLELFKTAVLAFVSLFVIVLGSIAWFASNSKVDSGGIVISHQFDTIKLATKGERQKAEEKLLNLANGDTLQHDEDTYYTEDGTIALRLSEDNIVVFPGASGTVTFYIIPNQDGELSLTLYVNLAGYNTTQNDTSAERNADPILDDLLSGHILLFRDKDVNGHYSGWLGKNNTIKVELPEGSKKDNPYPVTFHWIWPLRYENMVNDLYENGSEEYRHIFAPFIESQAKSMKPITGNLGKYRYSRIFLTNEEGETVRDRSKAYNLADEYIGTNAQYLYLAIHTSEVPAEIN